MTGSNTRPVTPGDRMAAAAAQNRRVSFPPVLTAAGALVIAVAIAGCGLTGPLANDSPNGPTGRQSTDRGSDTGRDSDTGGGSNTGGGTGPAVIVDRVIDGDSLEVTVDGRPLELRLEGYNAPEMFGPPGDGGGNGERTCNGEAARDGLAAVLDEAAAATGAGAGSEPELVTTGTDRFGRTLGDLLVDDEWVTETLIDRGLGLAIGDSELGRELMWSAADRAVGIWGDQCPIVDSGLAIGRVEHNPPGDDRLNLADEWVEITNTGSASESLERWVLRDETTSNQFELSGRLEPGATMTVRTGGDRADSDLSAPDPTLYLGESFPVWSNSGDTVVLVDPAGGFVDWRFIPGD